MFVRNGQALGSVLKSAFPGAEPTPKKRGRPAKAESASEQKADVQDTPPPAKPSASASATAAETKPPTVSSETEEKK